MSFTVNVGFDEAEHRYYVVSSDVPGLNVETDTFEEFVEVAKDLIPYLVIANSHGLIESTNGATIRFEREIALA